ncbi:hypothetical protein TVAG_018860 [Trichomonas vaginalis G3]|uniref:Uncharacterized protein n=1 Tax=Trichomonas vaginalis (strain ATCC PRA-98 / G3) TaxID=412133 RepID=A2GMH0_TRIV3|nr:hypothetical protein TVAGG3_0263390 [Trichomonas vaginalis G3]EAX81647.1 hypothetical protein TVAG_018860 [Trichomonas vaginalis G3]KAI5525284.1 hypothetical protein TVAGG3_0263390 [Trichomonas vaginalis G3]|eukprot:XP_001294577.1 hypothetical protein [Trichomonas vaginalis G3]
MAQVGKLGKLSCQILPTFQVLPSDIPSSSFRHSESFLPTFQVLPSDIPSPSFQLEKNFPTTGKKFPDNWKKISCCSSVNHSNFRKLRTFWSNDRKSFSFQQEKFFLPTGHKRMTDVPLPECLPKPEEPTAPAPQQTY